MEANILPDSNKKHSLAVRRYTEISSIQEFPSNKVLPFQLTETQRRALSETPLFLAKQCRLRFLLQKTWDQTEQDTYEIA